MIRKALQFVDELVGVWQAADRATFLAYLSAVATSLPQIILERSLRPADMGMVGRQCSFRPFGKKIIMPGQFFALAREIYCQKCYFPQSSYWLNPTDCVVDLGANVGYFSTLAGLHASRVIALEAQSGFVKELETNFRQNNVFDKIHIEFGIIGGGCGVLSDETQLKKASHYDRRPPSISLLDLIERHHIETVDFLKVDIEGSEFDLFVHNTSWLKRVRRIAMEFHQDFGDIGIIIKVLEKHSFQTWLVNKAGKTLTDPTGVNIGYLFANKC